MRKGSGWSGRRVRFPDGSVSSNTGRAVTEARDVPPLLFDLDRDPLENVNLTPRAPADVNRLAEMLGRVETRLASRLLQRSRLHVRPVRGNQIVRSRADFLFLIRSNLRIADQPGVVAEPDPAPTAHEAPVVE